MGLLSILNKGLSAMIDEAKTPESFKTGQKLKIMSGIFYLSQNIMI